MLPTTKTKSIPLLQFCLSALILIGNIDCTRNYHYKHSPKLSVSLNQIKTGQHRADFQLRTTTISNDDSASEELTAKAANFHILSPNKAKTTDRALSTTATIDENDYDDGVVSTITIAPKDFDVQSERIVSLPMVNPSRSNYMKKTTKTSKRRKTTVKQNTGYLTTTLTPIQELIILDI